MLILKESVSSLKEETAQHWFSFFSNCPKVLKIFND